MLRAVLSTISVLMLAMAGAAHANESAPVRTERVTATLVSDTDAVAPGAALHLGLRLRIAPGWHTYWQNPGDAGAPPELTLTLPLGAHAGEIQWPTPVRLPEGPVMTYSYVNEVLLPVSVTPGPGGGLAVDAAANWLVCEKICVPEEGQFHLDLPGGTPGPSAEAPLFAQAAAHVPQPSPFPARISPDGVLSLTGAGLSPATVAQAWFFPAAAGPIDQAAPQPLTVRDGVVTLALKRTADPVATLAGVVVLRDPAGQESALQVVATPGQAGPGEAAPAALGMAHVLLLALAGGLILNLMPCVFPVLAMKAVSIAGMSGAGRGAVRAEALMYTLGVLVAFAALAGVLLGLRAAGDAAGWGFQFQSPMFVAAMAWLLFAVGLNLSGVYHLGASVTGAGQGLASKGGHAGSFFTGLLAVLVATPCTAPFMGAAIAAALAAPAWVTVLVFLAMGLGLALPYALLAAMPALARALPRPGAWMNVLKQAMAFPMYGAAAWLVWVVSQQTGPDGVLGVAAGFVLLGFGGWAWGAGQSSRGVRGQRAGQAGAVVALAAAAFVLFGLDTAAPAAAQAAEAGTEPFTPARLAALRAEGRPVFVNMTASWCVTCLVNERVALSPAEVRQAFNDRHVAYLKGDWTRQDPMITAFLRGQDRDGVPLYVFYPPHQPGRVLPQILTAGMLLDELNGG